MNNPIVYAQIRQGDTQLFGTRAPSCPGTNDHEGFDQHFTVKLDSSHSYGLSMVNHGKCEETPEHFPEFRGTVKAVLQRLSASGHVLDWNESGEHLVIRNTSSTPTVLKVLVREFRFSTNEPLTKASSNLLGRTEVQHEMQAARLVEYGPELGFAQVQKPSTPKDMITLSNVTVLEVLNTLAGARAVWLYKQSSCARSLVSLNWPIR